MTHPREWRCLSCRAAIGQYRDGVLVLPEDTERRWKGMAELSAPCPQCGAERTAVRYEQEKVKP